MNSKYFGVLAGCAIGDALGMPVETWQKGQIEKYVGRVTEFIDPPSPKDENGERIKKDEFGEFPEWFWTIKKGQYTDDTILTLAIAESLIENNGINFEDLAKKQMEAFFKYEEINENRGFGGTTKNAFRKLKEGMPYTESYAEPGTGNGPIMKTSPFGIYADLSDNYGKAIEAAEVVAKMTHPNENAITGAVIQTDLVYNLLRNDIKDGEDLIERSLKIVNERAHGSELEKKLTWVKENPNASVDDAVEELGVGCVAQDGYSFTLFMFQKYWNDSWEGLIETVNCGGDCDTTGAMYGVLLGARDGIEAFPEELVNGVENSDLILNLAKGLGDIK